LHRFIEAGLHAAALLCVQLRREPPQLAGRFDRGEIPGHAEQPVE
jgi:hypothetical protein